MELHKVKVAISLKAVVLNNQGKILILQRPDDDYSRPSGWDLMGGGLDEGENPIVGVRREIREETGIEAGEIKPIHVASFKEADGCFVVMIGFKEKALLDEVKLSSEHKQYKWVIKEEFLEIDIPDTYKMFVEKMDEA